MQMASGTKYHVATAPELCLLHMTRVYQGARCKWVNRLMYAQPQVER